ncbi:MAG: YccF domain-containing protein [Cyclobacteriaceae bacterium]|nr:YccF domain-containing protein [Cyclobacteriaceae bacterium]
METIGNVLWMILGGFIIFILYLLGSLILIITIIGIPFGVETLKMAGLALMPFGREPVQGERAGGCLYIIMNVIWLLFAGIEIAIVHLVLALLFGITIIGLPFAKQHVKMAYIALVPFGMDIRTT